MYKTLSQKNNNAEIRVSRVIKALPRESDGFSWPLYLGPVISGARLLFPREKPEAPLAGVAVGGTGNQHDLMTLNRRFEDVDPGSTIRTLLHGKIKPKD